MKDNFECDKCAPFECVACPEGESFLHESPCDDCFREHCVGCIYSCPEEMEAYNEFLNCWADYING